MISAVVSARLAGLDRIKSGFTSRFANRLPIFGASRLPRSFNGRSLSGNAVYSQLDFAWRMRNRFFISLRRLGSARILPADFPVPACIRLSRSGRGWVLYRRRWWGRNIWPKGRVGEECQMSMFSAALLLYLMLVGFFARP